MVTVCESFTVLCQWLLNKLETHDLKECESTLKYEIWWWNWGKMIKVICTGVCVGPAHIRKTVDKNVPKSTGMSRVSSCESACEGVLDYVKYSHPWPQSISLVLCYMSYILLTYFRYTIFFHILYIYILVTSMSDPWAYGHRIISHHSAMLHLRNIYIHIYHTVKI